MSFQGRDLISMNDLTRQEIDQILLKVATVRDHPNKHNLCENRVSAMLFFEPSTRTRTSFEVAMRNLGGEVGGFYDANITSTVKQESLWDTVKMHDGYGFDVIVIRHPLKGAARLAAEAAAIPVINAGDGPNQHPTQTLLDLYSIKETQGKLDGITIAMVGDLAVRPHCALVDRGAPEIRKMQIDLYLAPRADYAEIPGRRMPEGLRRPRYKLRRRKPY